MDLYEFRQSVAWIICILIITILAIVINRIKED